MRKPISAVLVAQMMIIVSMLLRPETVQIFIDLLADNQSVLFYPMSETTAEKAAEIRVRYNLPLSDAFQVAVAIQSGCDAFLTNDIDIKRVKDIPILVVSEI